MPKLSIVIPCYNEVDGLPDLIRQITHEMTRSDIEVILVNDGSKDDTAAVLDRTVRDAPFITTVTNQTNQGYGGAILAGLNAARGTYIGWMHGDLQTPFKDVLKALSEIEVQEHPERVYIKGLRKGRPLFDQFFTLGMSIFESILLRRTLFDVNAQPNIFHRSFFASWQNPPRDFSLDLFALFMARLAGLKILRIPVTFPPRKHGRSHWNLGFAAKVKFIKRTIVYSWALKRSMAEKPV